MTKNKDICSYVECDRPVAYSNGLCNPHYKQSRRNGTLKRINGIYRGKKLCPGCTNDVPLDQFHYRSTGERYSRCKNCTNTENRVSQAIRRAAKKAER